ncbi:MAG: ferric reductase-like transmembrane domain-containing protein [Actinomycetota bacterium]
MSHAYWYATRGTGIAALVLLTAVVAVGIAGSLRLRSDRWPRFLVVGLHRNLTLLTLAFLALHIVTTVLDSFTPIGIRDAVVPFLASYRPVWLGLGAVAFDLLLALTITSALRARIGHRLWRAFHWLAYASWPVALAHTLGTGSDVRFGWMQALSVGSVLVVLGALAVRLTGSAAPAGRRLAAGAAAVAVVVGGAAWYRTGPGARGWAAKAGTPQTAVATPRHVAAVTRAPQAQTVSDVPSAPFDATLHGHLTSTSAPGGLVRIDIRARTRGAVTGRLWIRLEGTALDGGGVAMNASGVRFGPDAAPDLYAGSIRALDGTHVLVGLRDARGRRLDLNLVLHVDQTTGTVGGTVRAVAAGGDSE